MNDNQLHCVPLNQPKRKEYDRQLKPLDVCFSDEDYAQLQKHYRELLRKCGEACK